MTSVHYRMFIKFTGHLQWCFLLGRQTLSRTKCTNVCILLHFSTVAAVLFMYYVLKLSNKCIQLVLVTCRCENKLIIVLLCVFFWQLLHSTVCLCSFSFTQSSSSLFHNFLGNNRKMALTESIYWFVLSCTSLVSASVWLNNSPWWHFWSACPGRSLWVWAWGFYGVGLCRPSWQILTWIPSIFDNELLVPVRTLRDSNCKDIWFTSCLTGHL